MPNDVPVWSPDGSRILYDSGTPQFVGDNAFHTVRPDGSGDTRLSFIGLFPDWGPAGDGCGHETAGQLLTDLQEELDDRRPCAGA